MTESTPTSNPGSNPGVDPAASPTGAPPLPTSVTTERDLIGFDAATWRAATRDPSMRSPIAGLFVLDSVPDLAEMRRRLERLSRLVPVLRQRVVEPRLGVGRPRLVIDPDFDIDLHVHRVVLPPPNNWAAVLEYARRATLIDFDRDRPLWRAIVMIGLPHGRSAVLMMLHHAIADGQGAVAMLGGLIDWEPAASLGDDPLPPEPPPSLTDPVSVARRQAHDAFGRATNLVGTAVRKAPSVAKLGLQPHKVAGGTFIMARSVGRVAWPHRIPDSPLMVGRSTKYTVATLDLDFATLRAVGKDNGGSVNDAFLTGLLAGFRRYHEAAGVHLEQLRVNIPISLRRPGDEGEGNAVSIARVELPVNRAPLPERIAEVGRLVRAWRREPAHLVSDVLAEASQLLPVTILSDAAKGSDLTASNVPGPPTAMYAAGARIERVYPIVATIGAAVNVTLLSYRGTIASLGISADDAAVPHIGSLVRHLIAGFEEIGVTVPDNARDPLAAAE